MRIQGLHVKQARECPLQRAVLGLARSQTSKKTQERQNEDNLPPEGWSSSLQALPHRLAHLSRGPVSRFGSPGPPDCQPFSPSFPSPTFSTTHHHRLACYNPTTCSPSTFDSRLSIEAGSDIVQRPGQKEKCPCQSRRKVSLESKLCSSVTLCQSAPRQSFPNALGEGHDSRWWQSSSSPRNPLPQPSEPNAASKLSCCLRKSSFAAPARGSFLLKIIQPSEKRPLRLPRTQLFLPKNFVLFSWHYSTAL